MVQAPAFSAWGCSYQSPQRSNFVLVNNKQVWASYYLYFMNVQLNFDMLLIQASLNYCKYTHNNISILNKSEIHWRKQFKSSNYYKNMPSIQKKHNTKPSIFTQLIVPQFTMFEKEKMGKLNLNCKKKKKKLWGWFPSKFDDPPEKAFKNATLFTPQTSTQRIQQCLIILGT